jgi:hypothetical protein
VGLCRYHNQEASEHRERATQTERAGVSGARESVWGSPRGEAPRMVRTGYIGNRLDRIHG